MEINIINLLISILYVSLINFVIIKTNHIEKHVNILNIVLAFIPSLVLMFIINYSNVFLVKILAIFLVSIYIGNIIFKIRLIKGVVFSVVFISFYFASDVVTRLVFMKLFGMQLTDISSSGLVYCLYNLMSFVLTSILLNLDKSVAIYNMFNKSLDSKAKIAAIIILIILLVVIIVNILIISKIDDDSFTYIMSVGSFAASTLLSMTLFYFVNIIIDTTNNLDLTKEYNNKLELYNKTMQELIDTQRKTVHEFNNKMTVLNGYIADKKYEEASFFISKSLKETKNLDSSLFKNIKNSGLKSLLLFKYAEIKDKNIGFELMVNKRIESLIIDSDDACKILGIFLDNAIEASVNAKKPFISVGIVRVEDSINITIMNSMADEYANINSNVAAHVGFAEEIVDFQLKPEETFLYRATDGKMDTIANIADLLSLNSIRDNYYPIKTTHGEQYIKSCIVAPININGEVYGMVSIDSLEIDPFSDDDVKYMEFMKNSIEVAISNYLLYEERIYLANRDSLTKLYNRVYIENKFDRVKENALNENSKFYIVIFDIDNLKYINDKYGHSIGDLVITKIAKELNLLVGENDALARIGGDEFLGIFHEKDIDILFNKVKNALINVNQNTEINNVNISCSFSFGISTFGEDGQEFRELFKKADERMYIIKNHRETLNNLNE